MKLMRCICLLVPLLSLSNLPANATTVIFTNSYGDNNWENKQNWSTSNTPDIGDTALIYAGLNAQLSSHQQIEKLDVISGARLDIGTGGLLQIEDSNHRFFQGVSHIEGGSLHLSNGAMTVSDDMRFWVLDGQLYLNNQSTLVTQSDAQEGFIVFGNSQLAISSNSRFENLGKMRYGGDSVINSGGDLLNEGNLVSYGRHQVGAGSSIINGQNSSVQVSNEFRLANGSIALDNGARFENKRRGNWTQTGGLLDLTEGSVYLNEGNMTMHGGTFRVSSAERLNEASLTQGFFNNGLLELNGGLIEVNDGGYLLNGGNDLGIRQQGGTLRVESGGTLELPKYREYHMTGGVLDIEAGGTVISNSAEGIGGRSFTNDGAHIQIDGELTGSGSLIQTAGTLTVNGLMQQSATNTLYSSNLAGVELAGGRLNGNGTVAARVVNSGGTIGPGESTGTFTFTESYQQLVGGKLEIEIDSISSFDVLQVLGDVELDGLLNLVVANSYIDNFQLGDVFTIITWHSFTGRFAKIAGLNFGVARFDVNYGASGLTLTVVDVPTPATIPIFVIALSFLFVARLCQNRFRKARASNQGA